jgi:hypothetical protein
MRRRILALTIAAALFGGVAEPALAQNSAGRSRAHEVQAQAEDAGGRHSHGEGDELARPISSSSRRPRAARLTGRKC